VQSVEFVKVHATGNGNGGKAKGDISIFGQEAIPPRAAGQMNLAIRSIEGNLGLEPADSFHRDCTKTSHFTLTDEEVHKLSNTYSV